MSIHNEIQTFVYKNDLKQSQIARMAGKSQNIEQFDRNKLFKQVVQFLNYHFEGVNQAYVSKFLRGEFFDLSENGKTHIYKWYIKFIKNPSIYREYI